MEREWTNEMITQLVVAMFIAVPLVFLIFLTIWEWPWVRVRIAIGWRIVMSIAIAIVRRYVTIATPHAKETETHCDAIATPCNACKGALRVADVADVPDIEAVQIATLATLIRESTRKPFAHGKVSQTRALKAVFGVAPSSSASSEYQRLLRLLRAALRDNDETVYRPLDENAQPIVE